MLEDITFARLVAALGAVAMTVSLLVTSYAVPQTATFAAVLA